MNVICPHIDRLQQPLSQSAGLTNRRFNRFAMPRLEDERLGLQSFFVVVLPFFVGRNIRRSIEVMVTINRASLVSMQPRGIATEGYEVGKRGVGIVPPGGILAARATSRQ